MLWYGRRDQTSVPRSPPNRQTDQRRGDDNERFWGLGLVIDDDLELFRVTDRLYDGLYKWFQRIVT